MTGAFSASCSAGKYLHDVERWKESAGTDAPEERLLRLFLCIALQSNMSRISEPALAGLRGRDIREEARVLHRR